MESGTKPSVVRVEVAWKTIVKVLLGVLLAFVAVKLWPLAELLIISLLLAVPLYRLVLWARRRRWPHWAGLLLASGVLLLLVLGLIALVVPIAANQASHALKDLPKLKDQLLQHIPEGPLRDLLDSAAQSTSSQTIQRLTQPALAAAKATLGGVLDVVLIVALAIYLMVDGPRALEWLITFFPHAKRRRVAKGLEKIGDRMVSYIVGQSIVSGLFAAYVMIVLSLLHVPMALLLAVIAGFLDVVPIIGISIALALGAAFGLTVSPTTSLLVIALYAGYHIFENYFLMPKVYGKQLRLSPLAVLLAMLGGGTVAGVVGAIGILPVVAAYPALESLWLSEQLEPEVVKEHQEQLRAA